MLRRKTIHTLTAHLLALTFLAGSTLASDHPPDSPPNLAPNLADAARREGAKMTEPTQAAQAGSSTIDDQKNVAITVYNSNIGLVKDTRTLRLPPSTSTPSSQQWLTILP